MWRNRHLTDWVVAVSAAGAVLPLESAANGQCGASPKVVAISQESAPGLGDFDDNILGYLLPYATTGTARDFYAYDDINASWNGACLSPLDKRSHLLLADTSDGLTLAIVHDQRIDADGGRAEMRFELFNDDNGTVRTVEDDPQPEYADVYTGDPGDTVFTSAHQWEPCCTDGQALSDLDGSWSMLVQFTEVDGDGKTLPIDGLNEWVAYSADGSTIPLALELDRRVRLQALVPCPPTCDGDFNGDGTVGIADLLALLANWGACP
jgi:hypothetical protein